MELLHAFEMALAIGVIGAVAVYWIFVRLLS
jgi:hypothetical protein